MPIFVVRSLKCNPLKPNEAPKWFVCIKSSVTITEKELAKQIADRTSLHWKAAEIAILALRDVLLESLLEGYTVNLEEWGSFYTTMKSRGADTQEEATDKKVRKVRMHMRLHTSFEKELQQATFKLWDEDRLKEERECKLNCVIKK